MQVPTQGGGSVAGANGGGAPAQSPMQVPMQSSAVQGAAGGGAAVQPMPAAPVEQAPPVPVQQPPVSGGGGAGDLTAVLPALQQVVTALTAVVGALSAQLGAGQAQAGAAGVAGASGGGAAAPSGCGCGGAMAAGGAVPVQQSGAAGAPDAERMQAGKAKSTKQETARSGGSFKLDDPNLTVKGKKMDDKQRANLQAVLEVGKEMGANDKVMKAAIATVIQESVAKNDSSVDNKDHDSLGLFQQRPSMGWGTREQISDPKYAAKKFFEKAIPNDKKKPDQPMTLLAQSVQISAFPQAYAKWESEAAKIVADFKG